MATVLVLERHPVRAGCERDYEGWLARMLEACRARPGVLWADAAAALEDRPNYVIVSEWRTPADLDAWESSEAFEGLVEGADPFLRDQPTRRRFTDAS